MTTSATGNGLVPAMAPLSRRVRAYFAPVDRATGTPTIFDASQDGSFVLGAPPSPWIDLGWCEGFVRQCGTRILPMRTGAPAVVQKQVRSELEATFLLEFESWGKLQMAITSGSQQMNLLVSAAPAGSNGSGGSTLPAVPLLSASEVSRAAGLYVGTGGATQFSVGDMVAVDIDYTGQTGYVGSGVSGAYVRSASAISDVNYVRRVTLNVQRIIGISNGLLQLGGNLLAGVPTSSMQVSRMVGFVDREGGSFFQEWSGLLCVEGSQGERVFYHYPRLQTAQGVTEQIGTLTGGMQRSRLAGSFRALPTQDANDGEAVLCYRSYLPSAAAAIL